MKSYEDLGLVNTVLMFRKAFEGRYAIPAYNFNNMEQLQAIVEGCGESDSPFILQVSSGGRKYVNPALLMHMVDGAVQMLRQINPHLRFAFQLDHGNSFALCKSCVDAGFSAVMFDGSRHVFARNIELTGEVVEYAHRFDVTVEGELGVLAGIEDEVISAKSCYTRPEEVEEFVDRTGVDSLAISIGTSHGAHKFKPAQCSRADDGTLVPPPLRFDILEAIETRMPGFPIVLHGASSVIPRYVEMINRHGGRMEDAVGVPAEQLRKVAQSAVCKINIDSDMRLAMTAVIRKALADAPGMFDPREYLAPARDELKKMIIAKNRTVLGSAGKGQEIFGTAEIPPRPHDRANDRSPFCG